ncbi:MAG TPA: hypothetical protein P5077_09775 [bacterium]|nr:hypothetical protein [bacterium]
MRALIAGTAGLFLLACDAISTDISVSYPFDEDKPEEYAISVTEAMNNLNGAITDQTQRLVGLKADTSAFPPGSDISVDTTLSLDDMLKLIAGETVTLTVTVTATLNNNSQTDTQTLLFSICDFVTYKAQGVKTEFTFSDPDAEDVHMGIMNLDTYCPGKTGEKPYLLITHKTTPKPIALSENQDLKDYKALLNKIKSATLDELKLTITQPLTGVSFGDSGAAGDTKISMSASLFSQRVKDCSGTGDAMRCTGIDFSEEKKPADFYDDAAKGPDGTNPYWIGDFGNSAMTKDSELNLIYTYNGMKILQDSIKNLDFQIGIKSWYKITPGATRPAGVLKATVSATFFFSIEPLR